MIVNVSSSFNRSRVSAKMVSNHKKDLEIVYNLQWKNSSGHGDDKANIVGMYDIPATTLNWETFKSYLLKNSGATVDDVKVYYVCNDKEFCIGSQLDFQLALYSFRQKARSGDIINLRLERISEHSRMGRIKRSRHSAEQRTEEEKLTADNNGTTLQNNDNPPDWFKKYMKGFKKEIVDEVTTSVMNHLSNVKAQNPTPPCHHPRKTKMECCKRPRKFYAVVGKSENDHKISVKSFKLERKLDCKLEKLEQKTMKIKEKKLALLRSNDDENHTNIAAGTSKSRPIGIPLSDTELFMDASPIGQHELVVPHMSGGETYHQEWHVINTGDMQWTDHTELRYAWGSEALKPLEKSVPCPPLKPGDKGIVSVYLEVPKKTGNYESYWHFYHEGRRFGHWLGCRVIVESPTVKVPSSAADSLISDNEHVNLHNWSPKKIEAKDEKEFESSSLDKRFKEFCSLTIMKDMKEYLHEHCTASDNISNASSGFDEMKGYDSVIIHDSISSSDSDNQSIISIADSNSPSDEFVVVPIMSECLNDDEKTNVKDDGLGSGNLCIPVCSAIKIEKIDNSTNENNNVKNEKVDESHQKEAPTTANGTTTDNTGFAFVNINGQKIPVPKYLLRPDYLATAEEAPAPAEPILNMLPPIASSPTPTIDSVAPTINTSTTPSIILPKEENDKDVMLLDDSITVDSATASDNLEPFQIVNEEKQQESIAETVTSTTTTIKDFNAENADNMSSSRLFMFPSNMPGFEVFPIPRSFEGSLPPESNVSSHATNQSSNIFNQAVQSTMHPSNQFYQYGYCGSPLATTANTENVFGYSFSYPHSHFRGPPPPPAGWFNSAHQRHESPNAMCNQYVPLMEHSFPVYEVETSQPANESLDVSSTGVSKSSSPTVHHPPMPIRSTPVTMLPNTLVTGAVNVASSAINTARSVINMFSPPARQQEAEQWENGAWTTSTTTTTTTTTEQESPREKALHTLSEMGFWDRNLNSVLLARYNNDLTRVISELVN